MPTPTPTSLRPATETLAFHIEEVVGRTLMLLWFLFILQVQFGKLVGILAAHSEGHVVALEFTKTVLMLLFSGLAVALTVARRPARGVAQGLEPRISALLGSFLVVSIPLLPSADVGPIWSVVAIVLMIAGLLSSLWCLAWLGRSYSVMATARKLVVEGPYTIVRHPLYACEMLTIIGVIVAALSVWSVLIGLVTCFFLYRRILNEEKILAAAFPEYENYARQVPRIVPKFHRLVAVPVPPHA